MAALVVVALFFFFYSLSNAQKHDSFTKSFHVLHTLRIPQKSLHRQCLGTHI